MSKIKELEDVLKNDLIVELKKSIEELTKIVKKKQNDKEAKEELQDMKDLAEDFEAVLEDIKNGDMSEEEASEILKELESRRFEDDEV